MKERLEDLLAEYIERRESGEALSPERFAEQHPSVGEGLLKALQTLEQIAKLCEEQARSAAPEPTVEAPPKRAATRLLKKVFGRS